MIETKEATLIGDNSDLLPVPRVPLNGLYSQWEQDRDSIIRLCEGSRQDGAFSKAVGYMLDNQKHLQTRYFGCTVDELFDMHGTLASLNADYWSKVFKQTKIYDIMPQPRRDEWNKTISERTAPDFIPDNVEPTFARLYAERGQYFAERVDSIFKRLSGEHVTNRPEGFFKRMIFAGCVDSFSYNSSRMGTIDDLRSVIRRFRGDEDEIGYGSSASLIKHLQENYGQWVAIDGNALKLKLYMNGNIHVEVHPEMAYRLNMVLASIYPMAIPSEFRSKPKKTKEWEVLQELLPASVIKVLSSIYHNHRGSWFNGLNETPESRERAANILRMVGMHVERGNITADFEIVPVINEIITTGMIPDFKSHQFYPTPEEVANYVIRAASIAEGETCLEPSAGVGGLAFKMPKETTTCVELSKVFCKVLETGGYKVINGDFLQMGGKLGTFDKIVMNPPFSKGRALEHVTHACNYLKADGELFAIVPMGFKNVIESHHVEVLKTFKNEFENTSIEVKVIKVTKHG